MLQRVALAHSESQCVAVYCSVLQCIAVCRNAEQCSLSPTLTRALFSVNLCTRARSHILLRMWERLSGSLSLFYYLSFTLSLRLPPPNYYLPDVPLSLPPHIHYFFLCGCVTYSYACPPMSVCTRMSVCTPPHPHTHTPGLLCHLHGCAELILGLVPPPLSPPPLSMELVLHPPPHSGYVAHARVCACVCAFVCVFVCVCLARYIHVRVCV